MSANKRYKRDTGENVKKQGSEKSRLSDRMRAFTVIIGASAGGLEAIQQFLSATSPDSGIAYLIIIHMDPEHHSLVPDVLAKYTKMPVVEVADGTELNPNIVYAVPSEYGVRFEDGVMYYTDKSPKIIDDVFRSLALDQTDRVIGVVMSGLGSDGAQGCKAIKENGGLILVQDPSGAAYGSMPQAAIATGIVDLISTTIAMPPKILGFVRRLEKFGDASIGGLSVANALNKVLVVLHSHSGHDFTQYKQNTMRRRVERRMAVQQIETIEDYALFIEKDAAERDRLQKEVLIGVTNFFRDPGAFESLRERILPHLLKQATNGQPLRIWVAGCSTGEEAYSIAIIFKEAFGSGLADVDLRIFASDIDKEALDKAREGKYPDSIVGDVSPERLQTFFVKEAGGWVRVKKELRELIVFALQDANRDPPFSRMDMISCRNLMIYFETPLQHRLFRTFHYALNDGGVLFMGSSETVGDSSTLFAPIDRKWKFFEKRNVVPPPYREFDFDLRTYPLRLSNAPARALPTSGPVRKTGSLRDLCLEVLAEAFAPPSVVCTDNGEILYVHERCADFLELGRGEPRINIFSMAKEGLRLELARGVQKILAGGIPVCFQDLKIKRDNGFLRLNLSLRLIANVGYHQRVILISFETQEEVAVAVEPVQDTANDVESRRIYELEREVLYTREHLQTVNEQLETSNEELKSTNEELQSANEELQSSNEELETAKEELQATNEELVTLNAELHSKIDELSTANSDLDNFLQSSSIATIFLDRDFRITRYSRSATKLFSVIPADVGRSIGDIASQLKLDGLVVEARDVLTTLTACERTVEAKDGRSFFMRLTPYQSIDNVIGGVVVGFLDITEQNRLEVRVAALEGAVTESSEPVVLIDSGGKITHASSGFAELTGNRSAEMVKRDLDLFVVGNDGTGLFHGQLTNCDGAGWEGPAEVKGKGAASAAFASAKARPRGPALGWILTFS